MSNKKARELNIKMEKERQYKKAVRLFRIFPAIGIALTIMTILLFLLDWGAVFNTDLDGNEVRVSGYNCLVAGISDNYTDTSASIGDMAVPFNYYAHDYVVPMSKVTVFGFFLAILVLLLQIVMIASNHHGLAIPTAVLAVASSALIIAAFAIGTGMRNSQILPIYCGGNPKCSIHSHAIFPALFMLGNVAPSVWAFVKARKAKLILK